MTNDPDKPAFKLGPATIANIERVCGMNIEQIRATPLAEMWKRVHSRPGPRLSEIFPEYKKAWASAHGLSFMLMPNLRHDLNMCKKDILNLRADFLSKEGDEVDSDGFWLHIQKLVRRSDPKIGRKYKPFWYAVFPSWNGKGAHVGPVTVRSGEASRLDFELSMAELAAAVLP